MGNPPEIMKAQFPTNSTPTEIATKAVKCYVMNKQMICAVSLNVRSFKMEIMLDTDH